MLTAGLLYDNFVIKREGPAVAQRSDVETCVVVFCHVCKIWNLRRGQVKTIC